MPQPFSSVRSVRRALTFLELAAMQGFVIDGGQRLPVPPSDESPATVPS